MSITRGNTSLFYRSDLNDDFSVSHTVAAGTTLLLVATGFWSSAESPPTTVQWSLGGGETLTYIGEATSTVDNDAEVYLYGLVNPTPGAGTVTVTADNNNPCGATIAADYIGTDETDVATAAPLIDTTINTSPTSTCVLSSGGSAGNGRFVAATGRGADTDPVSNDQSWNELQEGDTGGGSNSSDYSYYAADELNDSGASAVTITFSSADENAGIYAEIVAAAAGGADFIQKIAGPGGIAGLGGNAGYCGGIAG